MIQAKIKRNGFVLKLLPSQQTVCLVLKDKSVQRIREGERQCYLPAAADDVSAAKTNQAGDRANINTEEASEDLGDSGAVGILNRVAALLVSRVASASGAGGGGSSGEDGEGNGGNNSEFGEHLDSSKSDGW